MLRALDLHDHGLDLIVKAHRKLFQSLGVQALLLTTDASRLDEIHAHIHERVANHAIAESAFAIGTVENGRNDRRNTHARAPT